MVVFIIIKIGINNKKLNYICNTKRTHLLKLFYLKFIVMRNCS